ncbi:amyloid beta A4 precursor protein-binding family B member 1-interacting protein [Gracilinanus agilis]|uniref:amyloid beta A4 precursor protein-binding family B member 1-interacting protein n=1 Tax=Gracilinanus agilis TaxID=191870 RepID=UPI001CFE3CAE|nr:amyloid beta A4 precursor protein-binding family B member 1-interacting protein [Gracilinanus agilis]
MEQTCEDIDQMFSNLLGEMDLLTQSLGVETLPPPSHDPPRTEFNYSVGFKDLNESLNALEDNDLDALMADLVADISEAEQRTIQAQKQASQHQPNTASLSSSVFGNGASLDYKTNLASTGISNYEYELPPPPADPILDLPPPPPPPPEPLTQEEEEAQAKADKIKLALEKLKEAKVKKNFYLTTKGKKEGKETNEKMNAKNKEFLLEESFCGTSVIVPEIEGALYLKEDGKKSWKRRYFLLRASGIYYVPKGKTKTSRDLACFIQFENVNVYYGTQYRMKYKAPTDHCFVLKHPQIQKESQYIKYLCCDDARSLNQWVTGIRIAKYGKILYDNYQKAMARAGLASRWSNLGTVDPATTTQAPSKGHTVGTVQPNGQISQTTNSVSGIFQEAQRHVEATKDRKPAVSHSAAPATHQKKSQLPPPPPPQRRSSNVNLAPPMPQKASGHEDFPLPPPLGEAELPPPPPDFNEEPPNFVPPPPPAAVAGGEFPLPPPPPPPLLQPAEPSKPLPPITKKPPMPPKRQENPGPPPGGAGGEQDFMSDLMKALQKKRGNMS